MCGLKLLKKGKNLRAHGVVLVLVAAAAGVKQNRRALVEQQITRTRFNHQNAKHPKTEIFVVKINFLTNRIDDCLK